MHLFIGALLEQNLLLSNLVIKLPLIDTAYFCPLFACLSASKGTIAVEYGFKLQSD